MNTQTQIEAILLVLVSMGWIAFGAILLRRSPNPIGWRRPAIPSLARRVFILAPFLLLYVATQCALLVNLGMAPARIGQVLLLQDWEWDVLPASAFLSLVYLAYLLVLIAPSFIPRDDDKADSFPEGLPPRKSVDVSVEWKQRCGKFRARNRRWLIAAIAWLMAAGAVAGSAFRGILPIDAYAYAVLFLVLGLAVFGVASSLVPTQLDCPNCGCTPLRHPNNLHRWLDEIRVCELCHAKLA